MRVTFRFGFVSCLLLASAVGAQTGPALLVKPLMHELEAWESRGDVFWQAQGATSNDEDFQMNILEYQGRVRERDEPFVPRLGWDLTYLDLNTDDPALQQDLMDVSVGAAFDLGTHGQWQSALAVGGGYAGNSPFGEGDAWYGMATLRVGRRLNEKMDLALVLDYDGNRSIFPDIPIPGFALKHRVHPTFVYILGVPLSSIAWRPTQELHVDVSWTLMDNFDATVEYELSPRWRVFTSLEARAEAFTVDGLSGDDRLLFQQRRIEAGVDWRPWEHTRLIAAAGYTFGGEFSIGFDQRDSDLVADISDEPYVRFGFERRF
jgi:hypothetical protein